MNMLCYQCEQTSDVMGCTAYGACGKDPETAALQDLLIYATKDICRYAHRAYELGERDRDIDVFVIEALYSTLTNVNFDVSRFCELLRQGRDFKERARELYEDAERKSGGMPEVLDCPVAWWLDIDDLDGLITKGESVTIQKRIDRLGEDITSLQETLVYGIKGFASYADHAQILGYEDVSIYEFIHGAMDRLTREPVNTDELFSLVMKCGEINLRAMELLDQAHRETYGSPEPTNVRITPVAGKCIAVSGHDLKDFEEILKQTEGKGINVYTHGEMLACNGYPEFKKYSHFVGHYGGAWQDQRQEFDAFPGAILMTTNCIQKPKNSYRDRLFTTGVVGWPEVRHLTVKDFSPVIEAALAEKGFEEDEHEKFIMTGFAHEAVISNADKIVELVKHGKIRRFFMIGGCDGAKPGRNYYTELAKKVPDDCVILTLACGKFRFNRLEFGEIGGVPRLLDCGQCNDAYSAIRIATCLAKAFGCGVNELPLSFVLSWFEQKAVAILLTLLYLGIKDIRLGPSLPAFISPNIMKVLVEKFNIKPVGQVDQDLAEMLGTVKVG